MAYLDLRLDGDGCWPELVECEERGDLIAGMGEDTTLGLALLERGMASGKPSVTIRVNLADGRVVMAQTSLELLEAAVRAMRVRIDR